MRKSFITGIILLFVLATHAYASDQFNAEDWVLFGAPPQDGFFIGIELAELMQCNFADIGFDNFTFHIGQRFKSPLPFAFGWSFIAFHVDLSSAHIRDPNQVYFIEGDRTVLTGETGEADVWFDGSYNLLSFIRINDRYMLRMIPELGLGLGYGMWGYTNVMNGQTYKLETMMLSARFNIRTTIFDLIYIDYPLWDFCINLLQSRPAYGDLGTVKITRPEIFELRALITVGIIIKY
jgi:hypothetical protein